MHLSSDGEVSSRWYLVQRTDHPSRAHGESSAPKGDNTSHTEVDNMSEADRLRGEDLAFVMVCIWRHIFVNSEGTGSEEEVLNKE